MFPGFSKLVGFVSPIFDWNEVTILGVCQINLDGEMEGRKEHEIKNGT